MSSIKLVYFDPDTHSDLLPAIVELHAHCIDFDDALLRFHPPFSEQKRRKMLTFWEERIIQVTKGLRIPIMALSTTSSGGEEISGLIELGLPEADTGPFRGDVEMLMVSPNCRRQGIAKLLILELEKVAKARGRTLLVGHRHPEGLPSTANYLPTAIGDHGWVSSCRVPLPQAWIHQSECY